MLMRIKRSPSLVITLIIGLSIGWLLLTPTGTALAWDITPYDTDGDGQLSEAELEASGRGYPWNEDANGDGFYSQEEIDAAESLSEIKLADSQNGEGPHLTYLDTNNDGKLSWEEFQVGFPNVRENPDTNGDGHIELAELEAIPRPGQSDDGQNGSQEGPNSPGDGQGRPGRPPRGPRSRPN